jgi:hypothetical protein
LNKSFSNKQKVTEDAEIRYQFCLKSIYIIYLFFYNLFTIIKNLKTSAAVMLGQGCSHNVNTSQTVTPNIHTSDFIENIFSFIDSGANQAAFLKILSKFNFNFYFK